MNIFQFLKKNQLRFRYRIIIGDDSVYPYLIQRKKFLIWKDIDKTRDVNQAEEKIRHLAQHECMRIGRVVKEYTEMDYTEDKLKGIIR